MPPYYVVVNSFWRRLPRPIHILAPMEDVTDTVFRRIIGLCGRPDLFYTEFIHTDVVLAKRRGRPGVTPRLVYSPEELPLVAQIWGGDPSAYARASVRLAAMGFSGIDINMGCPVRKIRKKGACAGLIRRPSLAAELIAAAREGGLPVSVKTRTGYDRHDTDRWIGHLLRQGIDALTVHGRHAEQDSSEPADWSEIGRAAAIARELGADTVVIGNGDVMSRAEIAEKSRVYGLDGVMVGRGVFADPCLFATDERAGAFARATPAQKTGLLRTHLRLYRQVWGETRNYEILKKFYKIYLTGFPEAETLRETLNATHDYEAAERAVADFLRGSADCELTSPGACNGASPAETKVLR